ncbi:MAG: hypothetical protein M1824_000004 [Vezdaea acicularis]|nr:MAG: hypothetical protein M1824_000004 [Vezdaea acicularis]
MPPNRARFLLRGRVRIINLWRPIKHPVEDCPLAICDGSTVTADDLVECDSIHAQGRRMFGLIPYRPGFRWYYMSRQEPNQVLLFKNYDSKEDVNAKCIEIYRFLAGA